MIKNIFEVIKWGTAAVAACTAVVVIATTIVCLYVKLIVATWESIW